MENVGQLTFCSRRIARSDSFTLSYRAGRSRGVTRMGFWIGSCKGFRGSLCESESITFGSILCESERITFGFRATLAGPVTHCVTVPRISYALSGGLSSTLQLVAHLAGSVTEYVVGFGRWICDCGTFDGGNCKECSEDDASELHGDRWRFLELIDARSKILK